MASSSGMDLPVPDLGVPRMDPPARGGRRTSSRARGGGSRAPRAPPSFADALDLPLEATVVVPTFNEREAIGRTLLEIDRILSVLPYRSEILVVDDDSPHGTAGDEQEQRTRDPVRL